MKTITNKKDLKEEVFNSILGLRMAGYKLMDLGLIRDDDIDQHELWLLKSSGFNQSEYDEFRNSPVNDSYRQFMADFWEGADD